MFGVSAAMLWVLVSDIVRTSPWVPDVSAPTVATG